MFAHGPSRPLADMGPNRLDMTANAVSHVVLQNFTEGDSRKDILHLLGTVTEFNSSFSFCAW